MNFTSSIFVAFCLFFFPIYYCLARKLRWRNIFILIMSYMFYGWWDYRFLALIAITCYVDYRLALAIEDTKNLRRRKLLLTVSLVSNLGVLGIFKYTNFFIQSFSILLNHLGLQPHLGTLNIILPVGISFYTFQSISYVFDVYRKEIKAERDAVLFFSYVSFFPQLVAGPIERAGHLLWQFKDVRLPGRADYSKGVWLIIYGYFVKMIMADTLAPWVNQSFQPNQALCWSTILGTLAFGMQIYPDFRDYSLIGKGLATLLGFDLMWNFNFPYWASSVQDFWRRWHISLSTWLKDYLYFPLGGSRAKPARVCFNLMTTMVLGGLWHGAGLNFIIWGAWHGSALCVSYLYRHYCGESKGNVFGWLATMSVVFVGWFFFRATDYAVWTAMIASLGNLSWLSVHTAILKIILMLLVPVGLLEYIEFSNNENQLTIASLNKYVLLAIETLMLVMIFAASQRPSVAFIYFQF